MDKEREFTRASNAVTGVIRQIWTKYSRSKKAPPSALETHPSDWTACYLGSKTSASNKMIHIPIAVIELKRSISKGIKL